MGSEHGGINFELLGVHISIANSIIVQWGIIIVLTLTAFLLTRRLKKIPDKKQSGLEIFYKAVQNLVDENIGHDTKSFVPYIGTLMLFLLAMNLSPLLAFKAPTEDLGVTVALAIISFLVIQGYAIHKVGVLGYLKGYLHPMPAMLPMNIVERIMIVVSLSLRLFGNVAAGTVILKIVYDGLGGVHPVLLFGIPVPIHIYFDLFDGVVQMVIFIMLTMVNIKIISEH